MGSPSEPSGLTYCWKSDRSILRDAFPNSSGKETHPLASVVFCEAIWLDIPFNRFLPAETSPPAMIGSMQRV